MLANQHITDTGAQCNTMVQVGKHMDTKATATIGAMSHTA